MSLPSGFRLRPAMDEDAAAVAAFASDETEAFIGARVVSAQWLLRNWTAPSVNRKQDIAVVEAPDGGLCGCLGVQADPPYTRVFARGMVAPPYHGRGIGAALVAENERRARRFVALADPGLRVVVHTGALADAEELFAAHREAFSDHWGDGEDTYEDFRHHMLDRPEFDPELWLLAWHREELAGYLGAQEEAIEDPRRGYVALLGVRRPYRRRGVGEALLRHAFQVLFLREKHGCDLHVDAESLTGATRLYERVGMRAHPRFALWERQLRPGGRR